MIQETGGEMNEDWLGRAAVCLACCVVGLWVGFRGLDQLLDGRCASGWLRIACCLALTQCGGFALWLGVPFAGIQ